MNTSLEKWCDTGRTKDLGTDSIALLSTGGEETSPLHGHARPAIGPCAARGAGYSRIFRRAKEGITCVTCKPHAYHLHGLRSPLHAVMRRRRGGWCRIERETHRESLHEVVLGLTRRAGF